MERDAFLRGMSEAVERERERVATVHERVACPRCGMPVGERCVDVRYLSGPHPYRRRPVKHPHAARQRADGIPDR